MKFYSKKYPEMYIFYLKVRFQNGVFETEDKELIEKLKLYEDVTWDEESEVKEEVKEETPKAKSKRK